MRVHVHWEEAHDDHEGWSWNRALYAYLHPRMKEILYLGKADGTTIRQRWKAPDKEQFWRALEEERRLFNHRVLVGAVVTDARLTRQALADIESMLIFAIEPWGNIASTRGRIYRPGLVVHNRGRAWPGPRWVRDTQEHVEFR